MNQKYIQLALTALLAATLFPSLPLAAEDDHESHGAEEEEHAEHAESGSHDEHGEEDVVQLTDAVAKEFGIEVGVAGSGLVARTVVLPAEVRPNEEKLAHIAPRFPGIAREVKKRIGDVVKAGDTLAVIESSESLAPYSLKTQIDGVIVERHITRGEPVSQARGRVFTVADLSDVWVDISVYQKHLHDVKLGQKVSISAGHDFTPAAAEISYVSPVVDEETRTATARIVLPNPDGEWKPGLFVTAEVELEQVKVPVSVPRTALEQVEGNTVVFVKDEDGYEPRTVTLGLQGVDVVEVTSGLSAGDSYVTRGGFTLKSELARGELSGGHSH
jgi:membrane fusion protein, heavy metal efflux system